MADETQKPSDPLRDAAHPHAGDDPRGTHNLPSPQESDAAHRLPWPGETDPAQLGERFEHGASPEQRTLAESYAQENDASGRDLGRDFANPNYADRQKLAESFADPNARDDMRLGKSFEESNSSGKRHKPPLAKRVHKPRNWRPVFIVVGCLLLLMIVGGLLGWLPRHRRNRMLDQQTQQRSNEKPIVQVQRVRQVKDQQGLVLPGTTIPMEEAYIYARANGYLKKRYADIGDRVTKGQLLAVIEAPDLDAQVAQAREQLRAAEQQLEQQRSQLALAAVTVNRWRVLVAKGVFSRQEGDQQETNYASAIANVAAAERNVEAYRANLQHEEALQSYEYVRAPFSGIITQRNVDVGALIAASGTTSGGLSGPAPAGQTSATGGSQQAGQANTAGVSGTTNTAATPAQSPGQGGPLFGIAQVQRLRILASVPEGYVTSVRAGGHAQVSFQEYPGTPVLGDITRTADSVDLNTRTMLTEVQVDNRNGRLKSGMYAVVTFPPAPGLGGPLMITGDAIVIRNDQTSVAKVVNGKIQIVPVVVGRDFGSAVEIVSGLHPGDMVVTQVTDDVLPGVPVQARETPLPAEAPTEPPQQNKPPGGSTRYGNIGITDQSMQGQAQQQSKKGAQNGKSKGANQNSNSPQGKSNQ